MSSQCMCSNVRRLGRRITSIYDAHLTPHGLSVSQFSLLQRLARVAPIANLAFAVEMGMDRSTLSRALKPLIASGWIETVDMPEGTLIDKRSFGLQLTPSGTAKYNGAVAAWLAAEAHTQQALGPVLSAQLMASASDAYALLEA